MLGDSGHCGEICFEKWEVIEEGALYLTIFCVFPVDSALRMSIRTLDSIMCDLIYVPWLSALIQASRIRGLRFAVSVKWDPICFEEWNVLVAARYLCFFYLWSYCHFYILYFPWAKIPMLSKIATWMPAVGSPWDFHTFSGFHIYSPNLPWFLN